MSSFHMPYNQIALSGIAAIIHSRFDCPLPATLSVRWVIVLMHFRTSLWSKAARLNAEKQAHISEVHKARIPGVQQEHVKLAYQKHNRNAS